MTGTGAGNDGAPSDGGSLHRPRRLRPLGAESRRRPQQPSATTGDAPVPAACPWLRLASDPRARSGHVTDDHRCDVKPDHVPDPGHQLAYCLSTNHVSCPHLRSRDAPVPPKPLRASPIEPTRSSALATADGPAPPTGSWMGRAGWAALGGLIAVTIIGALALLYAAPAGPLPSPPENARNADAAATTAPDLFSATPQQLARMQLTADDASDGDVTPSQEAGASDGEVAPSEETGASDDQQSGGEASDGQPPFTVYVVNPGDTLLGIAYRLDTDVEAIADANGLDIDSTIYFGQELLIPVLATPGD